jgi:hypothetical protein
MTPVSWWVAASEAANPSFVCFWGRLPPNPDNPELIVKGSPWDH